MTQTGAMSWALKGRNGWGGMTTQSKGAPGQFELLENVYVSQDGHEIRLFPGYLCIVDPVVARLATDTSPTVVRGYEATHVDVRRPVSAAVGTYRQLNPVGSITDTMLIWNRVQQVHFIEQLHGRWVIGGEGWHRIEPIYNAARTAFVYVTSYDDVGGTEIRLTLNTNMDPAAVSLFNNVRPGDRIYIEGATGVLATLLNGKSHALNAGAGVGTAAGALQITTNPGGAIAAQTGQAILVGRVSRTAAAADSTVISDDQISLQTWTTMQLGDVDAVDPVQVVYPAHVANRQRDVGDAIGNVDPGCTGGGTPRSRRRQLPLPYRIVPHVAGNRLIMVVPGYGCVFQLPMLWPVDFTETSTAAGVPWISNDVHDKPRCAGTPKAIQFEDADKAVATSLHVYSSGAAATGFGGTDVTQAGRVGRYKFKFAYKDDATGEIGLCSEPIEVTTTATTYAFMGLRFFIYYPGYVLHESLAMSVNVYRTAVNGDTFYFDRTIPMQNWDGGTPVVREDAKYGIYPSADGANTFYHHLQYDAVYQSDEVLVKQTGVVPETIEQMPMGAKAARTLRGWTVYGGALGNSGPQKEMVAGTASLEYVRNASGVAATAYNNDEVNFIYSTTAPPPFEGVESSWGCSVHALPPAYAGQQIASRTLFPFPRQIVRTNKLVNTVGGDQARMEDIRFSVVDTPVRSTDDVNSNNFRQQTSYLLLPRGKLQIAEQDNPGVTPATNTTLISDEWDEDVEGIGSMGGQGIVCTRSKTYLLGFSQSPVGVPAEIASDRFGCIAANSMVEFDGGCAWLSDRGPVAMQGGAVTWIGEPLAQYFEGETSRFKRDNDGMMRHSWACHDAERGLLYFGVFEDRAFGTSAELSATYLETTFTWTTASSNPNGDRIKSRFPCDTVLVYSYRVGAWSIWRPPSCLAIQWMCRGQDGDGNARVFFLGSDRRIYALDDAYGQFDRESNLTAVLETGTVSTIGTTTPLVTGIRMRVGMNVAFYTGGAGTELTFLGLRTIASTTGTTINLSSPITLPAGAKMVVGLRDGTIRSTFFNVRETASAEAVSIDLRYSLHSRYSVTGGAAGSAQAAFAKGDIAATIRRDRVMKVVERSMTNASYDPLGDTSIANPTYSHGLKTGQAKGQDVQAEIDLLGGAQVRLLTASVQVK